ncbi:MAG TPA: hypothetical protein VI172_08160 [Candidatus Dormibacteraeota bacterium]
MTGRWFRDVYRDAVWESPTLKAAEKAVAETYARHARDTEGNKSAVADLAWLTYERLMEKAGIGRRASVSTAVTRLVDLGWLKPVQQVSRRATVYRLTIPVGGSSDGGTTEADEHEEARSSDGGTTVVPFSGSGSSTSASGSSDGGTQPLGPSKELTITPTSPTPPPPGSALVVVDAEIVEEEGASTSSPETQTEKLIDDVVALKPNWRRKRPEIREQIQSLLLTFDNNFAAVAGIALGTARAPDTAHPSRMTAGGNPVLIAATTARTIAHLDTVTGGPANTHPDAHPYEAKPDAPAECQRCLFPEANGRHRGFDTRASPPVQRNTKHVPYRNPPNQDAYDDWKPQNTTRRHKAWTNPTDPHAYEGEL